MSKKGTTMDPADLDAGGPNSAATLLAHIRQIEELQSEQSDLAAQIKEEKAAIRGMGFDLKIVNKILQRRRMSPEERGEQDALIQTYETALERADAPNKLAGGF